jgi:hypothetical protein
VSSCYGGLVAAGRDAARGLSFSFLLRVFRVD